MTALPELVIVIEVIRTIEVLKLQAASNGVLALPPGGRMLHTWKL